MQDTQMSKYLHLCVSFSPFEPSVYAKEIYGALFSNENNAFIHSSQTIKMQFACMCSSTIISMCFFFTLSNVSVMDEPNAGIGF